MKKIIALAAAPLLLLTLSACDQQAATPTETPAVNGLPETIQAPAAGVEPSAAPESPEAAPATTPEGTPTGTSGASIVPAMPDMPTAQAVEPTSGTDVLVKPDEAAVKAAEEAAAAVKGKGDIKVVTPPNGLPATLPSATPPAAPKVEKK